MRLNGVPANFPVVFPEVKLMVGAFFPVVFPKVELIVGAFHPVDSYKDMGAGVGCGIACRRCGRLHEHFCKIVHDLGPRICLVLRIV